MAGWVDRSRGRKVDGSMGKEFYLMIVIFVCLSMCSWVVWMDRLIGRERVHWVRMG